MAGVIPTGVIMHDRPQGRGYVQLYETPEHPWAPGEGGPVERPAHEFHYSALGEIPDGWTFAYEVRRGFGLDGRHDGIVYRNLLASYAHLRSTRAHPWAERFVRFVRRVAASG
jgi:cobyrinic acid a,c-diamide synthase